MRKMLILGLFALLAVFVSINVVKKLLPVPEELPGLNELARINSDFIGILRIDGILQEPVSRGSDNSYYLSHSFDGREDKRGSIFADASAAPDAENFILYGHNNYDGTMFSDLVKYKDEEFSKRNAVIQFQEMSGHLRVFKVVMVINYDVADTGVRNPFLLNVPDDHFERLSAYPTYYKDEKGLSNWKNILTLSTCDESIYGTDGRLLVIGVEV